MTNTDKGTCSTRDVVTAIRRAYRGEAKLGVEKLLQHLVTAGVVPVVAVPVVAVLDPRTMPIQTLVELPRGRRVAFGTIWRLQDRFATLGDLATLSFGELVAEPNVGAVAAKKIEVAMAGLSVLLRDGDPALLRPAPAPAPAIEDSGPAPDPEQAHATCGHALLLLAKKMMADGASVITIAAQIGLDPANARKQLRVYSRARYSRTSAAEVARIAAPILAEGEASTKPRKGRRAAPAPSEPETGNVVAVVFGAGLGVRE